VELPDHMYKRALTRVAVIRHAISVLLDGLEGIITADSQQAGAARLTAPRHNPMICMPSQRQITPWLPVPIRRDLGGMMVAGLVV
jgi:hypothetical protein